MPGFYLINLSTFKANRVELPGTYNDIHTALQAIGSGDQTFGFLNTIDKNLYFLSPDGKLSSSGIKASSFSVSPDREYLVAFGQKIYILKTDGTLIRDLDFPANLTSQWVWTIIWRPDSSGLFFTYWDSPPGKTDAPTQLYAMDLLAGGPILVDPNSPTLDEDFIWIAKPK